MLTRFYISIINRAAKSQGGPWKKMSGPPTVTPSTRRGQGHKLKQCTGLQSLPLLLALGEGAPSKPESEGVAQAGRQATNSAPLSWAVLGKVWESCALHCSAPHIQQAR